MRYPFLYAATILAISLPLVAADAPPSGDIELLLAQSEQCNSCQIFDKVSVRRGYGTDFAYRHAGGTMRVPIRRVSKDALEPQLLEQLTGDSGPQSQHWQLQLTVIVVRGARVLYFGNIADSADISIAKVAADRMSPPQRPPANHASLQEKFDYDGFFLEHWNLEYFVAVALGDQPPRSNTRLVDSNARHAAMLGASNVILWGAAGTPIKNGLFISRRMQEIRRVLERQVHSPGLRITTLVCGRAGFERKRHERRVQRRRPLHSRRPTGGFCR